jgi:hypothetical protein
MEYEFETEHMIDLNTAFSIKENDLLKESGPILSSSLDLTSISMSTLEESKKQEPELDLQDILDYKKQSLSKLRSVVVEKGMVSDSSKLKKHELLKLLGIE